MLRKTFLFAALGVALAASLALANDHHVNATLESANGSGVTGAVHLTSMPKGGTLITVVASGLQPGQEYLSLYYDNGTCDLEPYSQDDIIGRYTADAQGHASVTNKVDDDLDEIHSVSVRLAGDFSLKACAAVHM